MQLCREGANQRVLKPDTTELGRRQTNGLCGLAVDHLGAGAVIPPTGGRHQSEPGREDLPRRLWGFLETDFTASAVKGAWTFH